MSALQYKIFEKCLTAAFLYAKVFGLWIYHTHHSGIRYDFLRVVYSISFYVFMLVGYLAAGKDFVVSANKKLFVSFAFQSIFLLHTNIILIASMSLYSTQFLHYEKRKMAFKTCKEALSLLKFHHFKAVDIRMNLFLFVFKAYFIDASTFAAIWFNWRLTDSGASSQIYLIFTFIPIIIIRFPINAFYGGILIIETIFRQFNENLNRVLVQAKVPHQCYVEGEKHNSLLAYSRLSEQLDRLSVLHAKLIQATKAFNSVFSFQLVLSIISLLLTMVLRCFYEYIAIVEVITKNSSGGVYRCLLMGCTLSIATFDLYTTCSASESLINQANKPATLLSAVELNSRIDSRFHKSVDTFSSQILLNKLKLNQCGMFDLNMNTFQSAVSAIVSYAVMVIQFELAYH